MDGDYHDKREDAKPKAMACT
ncbi:uncharacterized protein G2W53_005526 [Senna tora]|uniref:Uncharacterized protein n=1 Tax=Senna tora TaxID=362788 RepID=A0A835CBS0_9FABA|nr:uncharacterized protein G2W53_005526 [Senna tora]